MKKYILLIAIFSIFPLYDYFREPYSAKDTAAANIAAKTKTTPKPHVKTEQAAVIEEAPKEETPKTEINFNLPIKCTIGTDCFIQNYVDMGKGDKTANYKCDHHSYNEHKGTDFRLITEKDIENNVEVIASRAGTVKEVRDGEPDINLKDNPNYDDSKGCGNVVILSHEDNYQTWYCHMKKGSVKVKKGDEVASGETLGYVGLSGNTAFPHLHFAIQHKQDHLDPFVGKTFESGCNQQATNSLWSPSAQKKLAKQEDTVITQIGLSGVAPKLDDIPRGNIPANTFTPSSDVIIAWLYAIGTKQGDRLDVTITFPSGTVKQFDETFKKNKATISRYFGTKRKKDTWETGTYTVTTTISRDGFKTTKESSFEIN